MINVALVIHLCIAVFLVAVVLLQRSEGGGLGIGSSGGMGNFLNPRGTANLLTRATAWAAALFFLTSVWLTVLYNRTSPDIMMKLDTTPAAIETPAEPSAPMVDAPVLDAPMAAEPAPLAAPAPLSEPAPQAEPAPLAEPAPEATEAPATDAPADEAPAAPLQ